MIVLYSVPAVKKMVFGNLDGGPAARACAWEYNRFQARGFLFYTHTHCDEHLYRVSIISAGRSQGCMEQTAPFLAAGGFIVKFKNCRKIFRILHISLALQPVEIRGLLTDCRHHFQFSAERGESSSRQFKGDLCASTSSLQPFLLSGF